MALRGSTGFSNTYTETKTSGTVYKGSRPYADGRSYTNVAITGTPTGGTFTLTVNGQTTSALAYNASAATVQAALEALSNVGAGTADVSTTKPSSFNYTLTWTPRGTYGPNAGDTVPSVSGSGASLTGGTSPAVSVD